MNSGRAFISKELRKSHYDRNNAACDQWYADGVVDGVGTELTSVQVTSSSESAIWLAMFENVTKVEPVGARADTNQPITGS
jgi:hypothetical protein